MRGYTENNIVILGNPEKIFELTNNIELWPRLFTEYKTAQVLSMYEDTITFELTTNEGKQWKSKRIIDRNKLEVVAERLSPRFPFVCMEIIWKYSRLPQDIGVVMTWIQEFEVNNKCGHDTYDMESYLNRTTRDQMRAVKVNTEKMLHE